MQARLEAAERLIGELHDRIAVMAEAHHREIAARDAVIAAQAGRSAELERQVRRDSSRSSSSDSPYRTKSRDRSLRGKTGGGRESSPARRVQR